MPKLFWEKNPHVNDFTKLSWTTNTILAWEYWFLKQWVMKLVLLIKAYGLSIFFLVNSSCHRDFSRVHTCNKQVKTFFHSMPQCSPFITPERIRKPHIFCWLQRVQKEIFDWKWVHNLHTNIHILFCTIIYMVFQIELRVRGETSPPYWGGAWWKSLLGREFFINWWESEEWFQLFQLFSKLKATFCKYLTSVKIKTSIIYLYNKCEVI